MSVELLGERETKWCGVLGKEKGCVESWNHCKLSWRQPLDKGQIMVRWTTTSCMHS